jgi:hypothetical protein
LAIPLVADRWWFSCEVGDRHVVDVDGVLARRAASNNPWPAGVGDVGVGDNDTPGFGFGCAVWPGLGSHLVAFDFEAQSLPVGVGRGGELADELAGGPSGAFEDACLVVAVAQLNSIVDGVAGALKYSEQGGGVVVFEPVAKFDSAVSDGSAVHNHSGKCRGVIGQVHARSAVCSRVDAYVGSPRELGGPFRFVDGIGAEVVKAGERVGDSVARGDGSEAAVCGVVGVRKGGAIGCGALCYSSCRVALPGDGSSAGPLLAKKVCVRVVVVEGRSQRV